MKKPLINLNFEPILDALVNNLPQALLLSGDRGVGLGEIASYITQKLEMTSLFIASEEGSIGVDTIRELYNDTRGKSTRPRAFIINQADTMTVQAQNAFLKLLEEPSTVTFFILLSNSPEKLLPTILSRTEQIVIPPITDKQSDEFLRQLIVNNATKKAQILFIARNLPSEMAKLATDTEYFEYRSQIMRDARDLLQSKAYLGLKIAQKYKDNRTDALRLLDDVMAILRHTLNNKPRPENIAYLDKALEACKNIEQNGHIRLNLTRIVL